MDGPFLSSRVRQSWTMSTTGPPAIRIVPLTTAAQNYLHVQAFHVRRTNGDKCPEIDRLNTEHTNLLQPRQLCSPVAETVQRRRASPEEGRAFAPVSAMWAAGWPVIHRCLHSYWWCAGKCEKPES